MRERLSVKPQAAHSLSPDFQVANAAGLQAIKQLQAQHGVLQSTGEGEQVLLMPSTCRHHLQVVILDLQRLYRLHLQYGINCCKKGARTGQALSPLLTV